MGRSATFRQSDLERALKAFDALGLPIAGAEITRDGVIRVLTIATTRAVNEEEAELEAWRAKRDGQGKSAGGL